VTRRTTVEVDGPALAALIAAAAGRPDPERIAAALGSLLATGTRAAPRDWLTVPETADLLGVAERTVRRAVARGDLEHLRVGRRLLIRRPRPGRTAADPSGPERTPR
jgi:excisionase family DNA binding protein